MRNFCLIVPALALGVVPSVAADQKWADLKGQVVLPAGEAVPARDAVNVTKDQDHCLMKGKLLEESMIVDPETKGVKNVVVWLRPAGDTTNRMAELPADQIHPSLSKPDPKPAVMDQPCCQFEPHVLAVQAGRSLEIKNSAPIPHNVNLAVSPRSGNESFNQILPPNGSKTMESVKAYFSPMNVRCDIHPWMQAYVWVFDHPYFAVTDEKGNFEMKNAPVGKYNLVVWHESKGYVGGRTGVFGQAIEITEDGEIEPIELE